MADRLNVVVLDDDPTGSFKRDQCRTCSHQAALTAGTILQAT